MTAASRERIVRMSCVLTLGALGLMVWSLFDPRPIPVITAMSLGQVLGTLSLGCFVYVVVADVRSRIRSARAARDSLRPAAKP